MIATFSEPKKYGSERGIPTLRMMSSLEATGRAQHVFEFRLGGGEPGRDLASDPLVHPIVTILG